MARKASTMIAEDIRKTVTAKDDEQDAVMQEMFDLVDVDGSGEISKDEFAKLYRKIADTVRADVAMTGELSLTGRVLPVGGIKEKTIAARRAGAKRLVFPAANQRDYDELPAYLTEGLDVRFAASYDDVFEAAFDLEPPA